MNINSTLAPIPNGSHTNGSTPNGSGSTATTRRRIARQPASAMGPANSATNGSSANGSSNGSNEGAPPTSASTSGGEQIMERAVILVLEVSRAGNRRSVSSEAVEIDAEREDIRISKRLLEAPQLRAIFAHDRSIRRFIRRHCLPSYFKSGMSLLPLALVETVDTHLEVLAAHRELLVSRFIAEYPDLVLHAQTRLRGLFDPSDYPDPEVVRGAFGFSWRYITLSVPTTLAAIDRSIFTREREKAAEQWDEAARSIQTLLRANMAELVGHMTERLTPGPDGQPKTFNNSSVANLAEFLRTFDARNITDDAALAALVARARELLEGVDPRTLRRSENLRETVREGFTGLQRSLDQMAGNRPARRIVLNRPAPEDVAASQVEPLPEPPDAAASTPSLETGPQAEVNENSDVNEAAETYVDAADLGDPFALEETSETPNVAAIAASVTTRRRADHRVPLNVRTTPEFNGFRDMSRRAGLPWSTLAHASAFERALQEAAGILTVMEDMDTDDYACAARLIADGQLRW